MNWPWPATRRVTGGSVSKGVEGEGVEKSDLQLRTARVLKIGAIVDDLYGVFEN